ncbi:MAG: prolyl-tRNA synthetase associated domain-containing protein [Anaerovoracaceae bacterium]|nr:prolyl-tRNA synthetase associated domain-containing protein [Anaerovoracaceae bacterium]
MLTKEQIYSMLSSRNIRFEVTEHEAVYNMADVAALETPYPAGDAKNLFLRDGKKNDYYLLVVAGDKKTDLKKFRKDHETGQLSFASEGDLLRIMGLRPGEVSPLGILNDEERRVQVYIDRELTENPGMIGVHPNDNTATVWMKTEDLTRFIAGHGNNVFVTDF